MRRGLRADDAPVAAYPGQIYPEEIPEGEEIYYDALESHIPANPYSVYDIVKPACHEEKKL
jgi:hypothetical protein